MISANDLLPDQFSESGGDKRLTTWYAQGHSDGLGDRLLMFDNTNAPSWEILRFKPALAREGRFEAMLRQRVEQLASFKHDSFPLVRPISRLGQDDGLAVVSTYSGGASLSEALRRPRSAEFALRLIRQLVPALAALQRVGPGVAHGAITIDRIFLNADGRLIIREHMIGLALDSLEWPAQRLWSELGLLVPQTTASAVRIDERTDITQFAVVVLSLMAGRRIGPDEYPDRIVALLDELTLKNHLHNPTNPARFQALRHWLERALQVSGQPFASAIEAEAALAELRDPADVRPNPAEDVFRPPAARALPAREEAAPTMWSSARALPAPLAGARASAEPAAVPARERRAPVRARLTEWRQVAARSIRRAGGIWTSIPAPVLRRAAVGFAVVAVAEAAVIAYLLLSPSATMSLATDAVVANVSAAAPEPAVNEAAPILLSAAAEPAEPPPLPPPAVAPAPPETRALPAAVVRTGGVRVNATIELTVLDGDRILGSSADGPVMATAGRRELDFVNSTIGFRVRRAVDVRAGQIVSISVPVPNGTLNINAQPWAAVWIDGNAMGETPIGNLSIVPGQHDILFRHPQFGERRERALVRPGTEMRVAVNFQK